MSTNVINPSHKPLPVSNLFMARQPILNRNQDLVAYNLLFRNAPVDTLNVVTDLTETALVIAHFSELGIKKVIDDVLGFIRIDAVVLMDQIITTLPAKRVVLEIVADIDVTPQVLDRIAELIEDGFVFSLNDFGMSSESRDKLMPLVEIIKLDQGKMPVSEMVSKAHALKSSGKKLWVNEVDTIQQFKFFLDLEFDYFQGHYFTVPLILPGKSLSPSQISAMQLMTLITTDAESTEIEAGLKRDVTIGLNILRLVNSAAIGAHRIDSFRQALLVLGRNQLQRWLQIVLYAQSSKNESSKKPLMMMALTRGKLMELIAYKHRAGNNGIADTAFMVGIMSLMDTLFGLTMSEVLRDTAVLDEVMEALLAHKGYYGELLALIENAESIEDPLMLLSQVNKFHLTSEEFYLMQLAAFEWSDNISHVAV